MQNVSGFPRDMKRSATKQVQRWFVHEYNETVSRFRDR